MTVRRLIPVLILAAVSSATASAAQHDAPAASALGRDDLAALAKTAVAISVAHDSMDVLLAQPRNKTREMQQQLRERLRALVDEILHRAGLTEEEYEARTYIVSTDAAARKTYDSVVVVATGAPIPGQYVAPPGSGPGSVKVPGGPVGIHIGHVVNSFNDTPNAQGLLQVATGEARVAAQHATLAMAQPGNLAYMKTHAGHVINAIDPTIIVAGPGLKYGLRKAALGVATHIELAAAAQGASANVITHAKHIATSARNTVERADRLLAIAQKVQAATTAEEAAALVSQMASLANQLIPGADANADGKITWEAGEGGLQQCDEHVKLMLAAEK